MASLKSRRAALGFLLIFQVLFILVFLLFVSYKDDGKDRSEPKTGNGTPANETTPEDKPPEDPYPLFQDIHVMIFIGFGFLMTFLKKYAFSALGFTFFLSAVVIQWGVICHGLIRLESMDDVIEVDIISLMNADIAAAAILISFGAVLGKTSPLQLTLMAILETAIFTANEFVGAEILEAVDAGGSMYVHVFGAYFGLAVSFVLARGVSTENEENNLESSSYDSDVGAMIGTIFLWMFWPSFNAGLLTGAEKQRAIINTYFAITASCLTAFAMSSAVTKEQKFQMVHVQNATLAGGVCMGTATNMLVQPFGALTIGSFAGVLSTLGYRYIQGFFLKKLRVHDTCGVNNLHGMPGVCAGLIGAIMAILASKDAYGDELYSVFPAMGPPHNRSAVKQGSFQLIGLAMTLVVSIIGGLITGFLLRKILPSIPPSQYYDDSLWWEMEEEEDVRSED